MKFFSAYFTAAVLGLTVVGCKKKDDAAPSKTQLLTGKNWIVPAETVSPGASVGGTTVSYRKG